MELHGTTEFGRFHAGFGGAVHGGAIASVLDEALGSLANRACGSVARTAFLNVTFRAVTPTDRPLDISARITSIDGRKLHVSGELCDGTTVCARAEGLFVRILSGPPIPPSA
jgi:acyl-coenzyme A thioesterase PaaI-like protein